MLRTTFLLLLMVFVNISAQRGTKTLFTYKLTNLAADMPLRAAAEHMLREDAADLVRIEAREGIESKTKTDLEGSRMPR